MDDLKRIKPKYPKQEIAFIIPVTPSVNHMYIPSRTGAKILTKEAKKYIATVQDICRTAMKQVKWHKEEEGVWSYLDLYFYFPDKRIRDNHNCYKLLLDSLEGLLFYNDYYVMPRTQKVELDRENPRIECIFSAQEWEDRE